MSVRKEPRDTEHHVSTRVESLCRGRKIAMDVARGLDKMHSRHIIHLDLKSPNILLTAGGTAKIAVLSTHHNQKLLRPGEDSALSLRQPHRLPGYMHGSNSHFSKDLLDFSGRSLPESQGCVMSCVIPFHWMPCHLDDGALNMRRMWVCPRSW